jgi:hypothetical protein
MICRSLSQNSIQEKKSDYYLIIQFKIKNLKAVILRFTCSSVSEKPGWQTPSYLQISMLQSDHRYLRMQKSLPGKYHALPNLFY